MRPLYLSSRFLTRGYSISRQSLFQQTALHVKLPNKSAYQSRHYALSTASKTRESQFRPPVPGTGGSPELKTFRKAPYDRPYRNAVKTLSDRATLINDQRRLRSRTRHIGFSWDRSSARESLEWLRHDALRAFSIWIPPKDEARARAAYVENVPDDHGQRQSIYLHLDRQTDGLYILGRIELETGSDNRRFAWYMLSIAAELGHLNAALLLHRLEQSDPIFSAGTAARNVIAQGVLEEDWRAIIAHVEHLVLSRPSHTRSWTNIERALLLLGQVAKARQLSTFKIPEARILESEPAPEDYINVDELDWFDPPARYIWKLCDEEWATIKSNEPRMLNFYFSGLSLDALEHRYPEAIYGLTQVSAKIEKLPSAEQQCVFQFMRKPDLVKSVSNPGSTTWIQQTKAAALCGIPQAMFNYGIHLLRESHCYPTLAMQWRGDKQIPTSNESNPQIPIQQHDLALEWLEATARAVSATHEPNKESSPDMIAYIHLFLAGLFSENGHHDRGLQLLNQGLRLLAANTAVALDDSSSMITTRTKQKGTDTERRAAAESQREKQKLFSDLITSLIENWERYRIRPDDWGREYNDKGGLYQSIRPEDILDDSGVKMWLQSFRT